MTTVYIDELIIFNLVSDAAVLLLTGKICALEYRKRDLIFALTFGLFYCVTTLFFTVLSAFAVKITAGILIFTLAFGREKVTVKNISVFFLVASFFAGTVMALYEHISSGLLPFCALFFVLYAAVSRMFENMLSSPDISKGLQKNAEIRARNGKTVKLRAFIDTGNSLKDPITGNAVMVADAKSLYPIFNDDDRAIIDTYLKEGAAYALMNAKYDDRSINFRLLSYTAVGSENGEMLAFKPECVRIGGRDRKDIIISIAPNDISADLGCSAIIGAM